MSSVVFEFIKYAVQKHQNFFQRITLVYLSTRSQGIHPQHVKNDMIGPPNSISNLRQVIFHVPRDEIPIETEYRLLREEVQQWNEAFWSHHNSDFFKQRRAFILTNKLPSHLLITENDQVSADEMSVLYKKFLDDKWKNHMQYNIEWHHWNFVLLILAFKAVVYRALWQLIHKKSA